MNKSVRDALLVAGIRTLLNLGLHLAGFLWQSPALIGLLFRINSWELAGYRMLQPSHGGGFVIPTWLLLSGVFAETFVLVFLFSLVFRTISGQFRSDSSG